MSRWPSIFKLQKLFPSFIISIFRFDVLDQDCSHSSTMRFAFVVACLGFSRLHLTRADNDDQERDDLASSPIPALKEQFDPSPETLATDYLDNEHEIGPDIEIVESSDGILNEIDPNYHMERNKKPKSKSKPTSKPGKAPKEKPVPPGEPPGQGCEDREDLDEILHSGMFNPCPTLGRAYHGFHGKRWPLIASSTCGGKDKMMVSFNPSLTNYSLQKEVAETNSYLGHGVLSKRYISPRNLGRC